MGHEHDRGAGFPPDAQQLFVQIVPLDLVQRAEGLVHQQHPGAADERPGDGNALAHPARELMGQGTLAPLVGRPAPAAPPAPRAARPPPPAPADLQRQADVVDDAAPGQQRRVLKNEGEVAGPAGLLRRTAEDADRPRSHRNQIGDGPQQCGLAAARRPQHGDEAGFGHLEADLVERGNAAGVSVETDYQVAYRDRRGGGTLQRQPSPRRWLASSNLFPHSLRGGQDIRGHDVVHSRGGSLELLQLSVGVDLSLPVCPRSWPPSLRSPSRR